MILFSAARAINHQQRSVTPWSPKENKRVITHCVISSHKDICGIEAGRTNWGEYFGRGFRGGTSAGVSWLQPLLRVTCAQPQTFTSGVPTDTTLLHQLVSHVQVADAAAILP